MRYWMSLFVKKKKKKKLKKRIKKVWTRGRWDCSEDRSCTCELNGRRDEKHAEIAFVQGGIREANCWQLEVFFVIHKFYSRIRVVRPRYTSRVPQWMIEWRSGSHKCNWTNPSEETAIETKRIHELHNRKPTWTLPSLRVYVRLFFHAALLANKIRIFNFCNSKDFEARLLTNCIFLRWQKKKGRESGFPYCLLTDFTKFLL